MITRSLSQRLKRVEKERKPPGFTVIVVNEGDTMEALRAQHIPKDVSHDHLVIFINRHGVGKKPGNET